MTLLLILASFILHWTALPGTYVVERDGVAVDTFTVSVAGACTDSIQGVNGECLHLKGRALTGTARSGSTFHALALNWANEPRTAIEFQGRGALPYTLVKVLLPSIEWTCTYAFQDSVPVYVKATCDFDITGDGKVNLSDFPTFAMQWIEAGRPLNVFADFGSCYQRETEIWP